MKQQHARRSNKTQRCETVSHVAVAAEEFVTHCVARNANLLVAFQACAWIPSCSVAGCDTMCVANIYGENKVMHSLELMYTTAMMCSAVSYVVKQGASGMDGRRLQVLLGRACLY